MARPAGTHRHAVTVHFQVADQLSATRPAVDSRTAMAKGRQLRRAWKFLLGGACIVMASCIAPVLYVVVQGDVAGLLLPLHKAIAFSTRGATYAIMMLLGALGAAIAAAIVGTPLGLLVRTRPALVGLVPGTATALFLGAAVDYGPFGNPVMWLAAGELVVFVVGCAAFCVMGARFRPTAAR